MVVAESKTGPKLGRRRNYATAVRPPVPGSNEAFVNVSTSPLECRAGRVVSDIATLRQR